MLLALITNQLSQTNLFKSCMPSSSVYLSTALTLFCLVGVVVCLWPHF